MHWLGVALPVGVWVGVVLPDIVQVGDVEGDAVGDGVPVAVEMDLRLENTTPHSGHCGPDYYTYITPSYN